MGKTWEVLATGVLLAHDFEEGNLRSCGLRDAVMPIVSAWRRLRRLNISGNDKAPLRSDSSGTS